ncbi:hypothetical protein [Klebsiella variicola]|uniref:hypothetical protein n=1 Tax=Klebsiella variicola TaxID=244366 RepID=UPI002858A1E9|nr:MULTISPECIES: hypothetical protein [Klebsiella]MDR6251654.1 hypothetical protein [Klebsiella variicola]MDR6253712.1 hypothetical protein [Klebsiella variicola]MDR6262812.1 hypothetical protein [Klebsiella sp. SORGH_AS_0826]MDR6274310.1 hypothetical protein [Klebsiella variicola]MDR6281826.1 hypothetical protein [Klebsiella variicola]
MTKSTITRERLQEIAEDGFLKHGESKELARMALAAMDSEPAAPVAEVVSIYGDPEAFGEREIRPLVGIQQMPYGTKLYRHAQQPVVESEPVAEVLSNRPGNDTSTIDRALPVGTQLYRHAQPAPVAPVMPDFKKLARELVDNLVDCGGLDEGVKEKYLEWAEKACRAAMLSGGKP